MIKPYKNRSLPEEGQEVSVYYNIRLNCLSITNQKGLVIAHGDRVSLKDAEFKVSGAGRQRVLREKRKNVHAKIFGRWTNEELKECKRALTYNPYKYKGFVDVNTKEIIDKANKVSILGKRIYIDE